MTSCRHTDGVCALATVDRKLGNPANHALVWALACSQPWSRVTLVHPALWHACGATQRAQPRYVAG
jgi:hypothetical protein